MERLDDAPVPKPLLEGTLTGTPPSAREGGWLAGEGTVLPARKGMVWFTGEGSIRPVRGRRQRRAERRQEGSQEAVTEMANGALRRRLLALASLLVALVTAAAAYHVGRECGAWEAKYRLEGMARPLLCLAVLRRSRGSARDYLAEGLLKSTERRIGPRALVSERIRAVRPTDEGT
jgi:hypothetical protein